MSGARASHVRLFPMLLAAVTVSCGRSGSGDPVSAPLKPMSAASLRAVPTETTLDLPVQASVYAWRDYLSAPDATKRVHDLMVSVQIRGGVVPPKVLTCDGMYLVAGDSVFKSAVTEQRPGDGPGAVECLLRGGPEWPVGAALEVIIGVSAGTQRTLIRRETTIDATS